MASGTSSAWRAARGSRSPRAGGADRAGTLAEVGGFRGWRAGSLGGRGTSGAARDGARARAERLLEGSRGSSKRAAGARYVGEGALVASSSTPRPRVGTREARGLDARRVHARERRKEQQRGGHHRRARAREDAREARPRHDTDPTRDGVRRRHHEYRALRQLRLAPLSSAWRFIRPRATTTRLVFVEPSEDWSARARGVDEVRGRRPTVAFRRGEGICVICETLSPPISPSLPLLRSTCWPARCPPPCTP